MKIKKFQRHPADTDAVILHIDNLKIPNGLQREVWGNAEFRAALEAAGKMED